MAYEKNGYVAESRVVNVADPEGFKMAHRIFIYQPGKPELAVKTLSIRNHPRLMAERVEKEMDVYIAKYQRAMKKGGKR